MGRPTAGALPADAPGPGRRHARTVSTTGLVALLLAACGGGGSPVVDPGDDPPAAAPGAGSDGEVELPACPEFDDPRTYTPPPEDQPAADPAITSPELFPDIAITDGVDPDDIPDGAVEHGMEVYGAAREWAEAQAPDHFAGMWLDGEHGAAVIAFTEDVERYAAEVRERFGAGWWVVEAEHSEAELARLQDAVSEDATWSGLEESSPGTIVSTARLDDRQKVEIMVVGGDDEVLAELADRFDHPAYCFVVLPPPLTYEADGEVRTLATAAGWRDGLSQNEDASGWLEVADDAETGERAFTENVPGDLPAGDDDPWADALHAGLDTVDWDREVVVVWSSGRSGSCPSWVEDLRTVDGAVAVEIASPVRGGCDDDWNPYRTVLAVDRALLPSAEDLPLPVEEGWSGGGRAVPYPAG
jgi:hypothetical protein